MHDVRKIEIFDVLRVSVAILDASKRVRDAPARIFMDFSFPRLKTFVIRVVLFVSSPLDAFPPEDFFFVSLFSPCRGCLLLRNAVVKQTGRYDFAIIVNRKEATERTLNVIGKDDEEIVSWVDHLKSEISKLAFRKYAVASSARKTGGRAESREFFEEYRGLRTETKYDRARPYAKILSERFNWQLMPVSSTVNPPTTSDVSPITLGFSSVNSGGARPS
jgi:hypothetical protein